MANRIRILIADDHAIVRDGIVTILGLQKDFSVVGEASGGLEAVRKAIRLKPDVVILDMMMPDLDGAEATARILQQVPAVRILILTSFTNSAGIADALKNGATGAISKSASRERLYDAIRATAAGKRTVDREIEVSLRESQPVPPLTKKQTNVLNALSKGLTNDEIARETGLSTAGIKFHLLAIFRKLNANNRSDAVAIALRKHLLKI